MGFFCVGLGYFFIVATHTLLAFSHAREVDVDRIFSKIVSILTLHSKCTGAVTFSEFVWQAGPQLVAQQKLTCTLNPEPCTDF